MGEGHAEPLAARSTGRSAIARVGRQTFASLQHRDYRIFWVSSLFMSGGQWIQQITLGWLVYDMTGSAILLGALNGARSLPFLFSTPIAGVAADRMDRRKLMLMLQPILIVTACGMGFLVLSGRHEVWHIFAFTLITATAWTFTQPVRQSLVPNLVPRHDLMNAIVLNSTGFNLMKIFGPALGGLLIAWFGAAGNFFVQSLAYGLVMITVYQISVPPTPPEARRSSAAANFREGWAYVRSSPLVLALIIAAIVPQIFVMPYQSLMPVFQKDVFQVGPEGLGLLMAGPATGAVVATLLLAATAHRVRRKGMMLLGSLVLLGVCLILFSRTTSLPVAMLTLICIGSCQMVYMATTNTLLQTIVPDALRGRVMSIYLLDHGLTPVGALLAGVSTELTDAPTTVAMMGIMVIVLAGLVTWRAPRIRAAEAW